MNLPPELHYTFDTGPLLCFGGFPALGREVRHRCHDGKAHWVGAVRDELQGHARGTGPIALAAGTYAGKGANWLTDCVAYGPTDVDVAGVLREVQRRGRERAVRKGRQFDGRPQRDRGEAQSIVHARKARSTFVASDDIARGVAADLGVPVATVVDIARQLVSEGHKAKPLASGLQDLALRGFDVGGVVAGPLSLGRPHRR